MTSEIEVTTKLESSEVKSSKPKSLVMVVLPLIRQPPESESHTARAEASETWPGLKAKELPIDVAKAVLGVRTNQAVALPVQRVFRGEECPITASLECYLLPTRAEQSRGGKSRGDLLIFLVSFNEDSAETAAISASLHRPAKCNSKDRCVERGHGGLCIELRNALNGLFHRDPSLTDPEGTSPEGDEGEEFTLRGDTTFSIQPCKIINKQGKTLARYGKQRGRAHALVVSRAVLATDLPSEEGARAKSAHNFKWVFTSRTWIVARIGAIGGLPLQMFDGPQNVPFNDLTLPVLLALQQLQSLDSLRKHFRTLTSEGAGTNHERLRLGREFAEELLDFRNNLWTEFIPHSAGLTEYLNALQSELHLRTAYEALIEDFGHWHAHMELVVQADQSASSQRSAIFLTALGLCIAVGALVFEPASPSAIVCSLFAAAVSIVYLAWQVESRHRTVRRLVSIIPLPKLAKRRTKAVATEVI